MSQSQDNQMQQSAANNTTQPPAPSGGGLSLNAASFSFKPFTPTAPPAKQVAQVPQPIQGVDMSTPVTSNEGSGMVAPTGLSLSTKSFNPTTSMTNSAAPFTPTGGFQPSTPVAPKTQSQGKFDQIYSGQSQGGQQNQGNMQQNAYQRQGTMQPQMSGNNMMQQQNTFTPNNQHQQFKPQQQNWNQNQQNGYQGNQGGYNNNNHYNNNMNNQNNYNQNNGFQGQQNMGGGYNGQMNNNQMGGNQGGNYNNQMGGNQGYNQSNMQYNGQKPHYNNRGNYNNNNNSGYNNNTGSGYNQPMHNQGNQGGNQGNYQAQGNKPFYQKQTTYQQKSQYNDNNKQYQVKNNDNQYNQDPNQQQNNYHNGGQHYNQPYQRGGYNNRGGAPWNNQGRGGRKDQFPGDWSVPQGSHMNPPEQYKMQNLPIDTPNPPIKALTLAASSFTPFIPNKTVQPFKPSAPVVVAPPPPPVDKVALAIKKNLSITEEDDIKKTKTILEDLRKHRKENDGKISMDLFKQIGALSCCTAPEEDDEKVKMTKVLNANMIGRTAKEIQIQERKKPPYKKDYNNKNDYNMNRDDNKRRGDDKRKKTYEQDPMKRQKDSEETVKLRLIAQQNTAKRQLEKNEIQKIRLILNIIAPDNYDKKFGQLREFIFPELKTRAECKSENIEYEESIHKLQDAAINQEMLDIIVKNIFKKAIKEKSYCIFYGDLCERMMKLELTLMDLEAVVGTMKQSQFRKQLLQACKETFEEFFDLDLRKRETADSEKKANFEEKLFGNMEFVGELFRRKILPIQTLMVIFQSLLGVDDTNPHGIDDLIVEAAVNLMTKVGPKFEDESKKKKSKKDDKGPSQNEEKINNIFNNFKEIEQLEDEQKGISNRIKILIKNMFTNKESGWEKTQQMNKGGPQTKAEVEKEVRDKYEKERDQQMHSRGGHDRRNDRGYNNDRRDNRDNRDNKGGNRRDDQVYQKKNTGNDRDNRNSQYQKKSGEGGAYGRGGREQRNDNRRPNDKQNDKEESKVPVEKISAQDLLSISQKNFENYENKLKLEQLKDQDAEDQDEEEGENKAHSFDFINTLKTTNGRPGSDIVYSFVQGVICEKNRKTLDSVFKPYYKSIIDQKLLQPKDFSEGISKIIGGLGELVMDSPVIHSLVWIYIIEPVVSCGILNFKKIRWDMKPSTDEEEDDCLFDETDTSFKLVALILVNQKQKWSWSEIVKWYDAEMGWKKSFQEMHAKLSDQEGTFDSIKSDHGEANYKILKPLLDQDSKDSKGYGKALAEELKKVK